MALTLHCCWTHRSFGCLLQQVWCLDQEQEESLLRQLLHRYHTSVIILLGLSLIFMDLKKQKHTHNVLCKVIEFWEKGENIQIGVWFLPNPDLFEWITGLNVHYFFSFLIFLSYCIWSVILLTARTELTFFRLNFMQCHTNAYELFLVLLLIKCGLIFIYVNLT